MSRISSFDLQQMEARLAINRSKKAADKCEQVARGVDRESGLHADISAECRKRGYLAFHGSMAHASRRTLGEPDFVILAPNGKLFLVEAKTRTGKLSQGQAAVAVHAAKLGHIIHVVRDLEQFILIIETL